MAKYPNEIYEPRPKENRSGVTYDPNKKTVIFAEDIKALDDEVVAIENLIGKNAAGQTIPVQGALLRGLADGQSKWSTEIFIDDSGNVGIGTTAPGAKLTVAGRISTLHGDYFEVLGSVYGGFDEYGETPLLYGAYNRMAFLTKEGGTVDFSPPPTGGSADNLFDGRGTWVYWRNPSGDISITINLPSAWFYMRELIIQFVGDHYPTAFTIEYYSENDNAWHVFDDVTGWNKNYYAKKTGYALYNTSKLRITMHAYNNPNYVHIAEIIWTAYSVPSMNYFLYRGGGQNVYGGVNLATVSGNVGIGTTSPTQKLEVNGAVRFFPISAPPNPTEGAVYYDSTAKKLKVYNGAAWETIQSS